MITTTLRGQLLNLSLNFKKLNLSNFLNPEYPRNSFTLKIKYAGEEAILQPIPAKSNKVYPFYLLEARFIQTFPGLFKFCKIEVYDGNNYIGGDYINLQQAVNEYQQENIGESDIDSDSDSDSSTFKDIEVSKFQTKNSEYPKYHNLYTYKSPDILGQLFVNINFTFEPFQFYKSEDVKIVTVAPIQFKKKNDKFLINRLRQLHLGNLASPENTSNWHTLSFTLLNSLILSSDFNYTGKSISYFLSINGHDFRKLIPELGSSREVFNLDLQKLATESEIFKKFSRSVNGSVSKFAR